MKAVFADYTPGPDSLRMHRSQALETLVIAAIRSGKTHSLRQEIIKQAWNNPYEFFATFVGAPEYKQLGPLLEDPITERLDKLGLLRRHNHSEHETILRNGRRIYYRSLDNYDAIRGLDIWFAVIDEFPLCKKLGVDVVKGRLLTTNGRLVMVGTPKGTNNWVYEQYYGPNAAPPAHVKQLRYSIFNNPIITQAAVDRLRADYDPRMARQEIDGEWVNLTESAVYYAFDEKLNVAEHTLNASEIFIGLDYNIGINAWIALQKDVRHDTLHVFAEGYGAKTTRDVAAQIRARFGERCIILDDASGATRQQGDARTQREILVQCGLQRISAYTSNPERVRRHAVVNAHCENGLGQRRLFVSPACKHLISEMSNLCYKPKGSDEPDDRDGKAGHITDALGYAVWFVSGGLAVWSSKLAA